MVLDPTICFERDTNQALQINDDKRAKYLPCLPYLSEKYGILLYNWDVTGLLFVARGSKHAGRLNGGSTHATYVQATSLPLPECGKAWQVRAEWKRAKTGPQQRCPQRQDDVMPCTLPDLRGRVASECLSRAKPTPKVTAGPGELGYV
ncbi:hypothetical protein ANN_14302 [Periplaneta americana]|uniref:Uncharacterized protein n=1 Tax=Periplaneta americana TaxID=6978 RepID=A0ABQ8SY27_PERAM|nr:hypothetical protein ANN_14302 [Periplaneta americana]